VSSEQRENLEAILRRSAFPVDIDVNEQRRLLQELTSAQPLPAHVTVTAAALGGVPTAEITVDGIEPRHIVLYFHGGVYVLGDAFSAADLASQVGRRTTPRSSPSTTGSPPSTRIRRRSTTLWQPTNPSCTTAQRLRTSPSGLPPLIIQAGSHEVLLDDAVRLARAAATADVEVTLDITPGVPHVFQTFYPILDEAADALDRAGQLPSAHLASAERVTA